MCETRELLQAVADGEITVAEAEAELAGYATNEAGRFDAARETRRGVPEAILAEGKTPGEVAELATTAVETTGRAVVTRTTEEQVDAVAERLATDHPEADQRVHDRCGVLVVHAP